MYIGSDVFQHALHTSVTSQSLLLWTPDVFRLKIPLFNNHLLHPLHAWFSVDPEPDLHSMWWPKTTDHLVQEWPGGGAGWPVCDLSGLRQVRQPHHQGREPRWLRQVYHVRAEQIRWRVSGRHCQCLQAWRQVAWHQALTCTQENIARNSAHCTPYPQGV